MSALIVPVNPLSAQTLSVVLSGQQVDISLSARGDGLYADVFMANVPIVLARRCLDRVPLIMDAYRGFPGDLFFEDKLGLQDPQWQQLGSRYLLLYMEIPA